MLLRREMRSEEKRRDETWGETRDETGGKQALPKHHTAHAKQRYFNSSAIISNSKRNLFIICFWLGVMWCVRKSKAWAWAITLHILYTVWYKHPWNSSVKTYDNQYFFHFHFVSNHWSSDICAAFDPFCHKSGLFIAGNNLWGRKWMGLSLLLLSKAEQKPSSIIVL